MILRFSAAAMFCIVGMAVQADVVRLANGDVLHGRGGGRVARRNLPARPSQNRT